MVAGSRTCKHFQAASQVNSHSNRYRPARPMRSRSAGLASRLDTASWKPGASSASNKCSPARAGRPSAPIGVETTGTPAAQASMILTRVPLPASTGTIATLARAKVAIVPVLAGSGTRVKIIEAWAAGVPVVSTPMGAEGLPARAGEHLLLADDAPGFQDAVSSLLANPALRDRIGRAGRYLFEFEFTWEAAWKCLQVLDPATMERSDALRD